MILCVYLRVCFFKPVFFFLILSLSLFFPCFGGEWAEKTLAKMSLDEKIGQLFIIPVCPLRNDERYESAIEETLMRSGAGGIIIKEGTLEQQFHTIRKMQAKAALPLLVVADAEWGLTMQAYDAIRFPKNRTLGAVSELSLLEDMGREIGRQLSLLGCHMNLAPVVDVNSNPLNPIIRMRSFGEHPDQVIERARWFVRGLQSTGVLGCAKHFPGHGDTSVDSHEALPFIKRTMSALQEVELKPFQAIIQDGIGCVMSAHIVVEAIDTKPASLSSLCMTKLLREQMGFCGLTITDALNMRALSLHYSVEEIARLAFMAGHDLLLYGDHISAHIDDILERQVPAACAELKKSILSGEIAEEELNRRVGNILEAKEKLQLHQSRGPSSFALEEFQCKSAKQLAARLYGQAATIVYDKKGLLPLAKIALDDDGSRDFRSRLERRGIAASLDTSVVLVTMPDLRTDEEQKKAQEQLKSWGTQGKEVVVVLFGSPYAISAIIPWASALVLAYEDCGEAWEAAADLCAFTKK